MITGADFEDGDVWSFEAGSGANVTVSEDVYGIPDIEGIHIFSAQILKILMPGAFQEMPTLKLLQAVTEIT